MLIFIEMKKSSDNNKLLKEIICGEIFIQCTALGISAFLKKPFFDEPLCCL